jgi:AcrR family transcriptional regulator
VVPRRRQQDRTQATRQALVSAGRVLFAERGYADVSADEIVAAAGLTRGALRHHFGDKAGLFRAVFEQLETETTDRVVAALAASAAAAGGVAGSDLPAGSGLAAGSVGGPAAAATAGSVGWTALTRGLSAFLDACEDPEVIRIALTDAPAVLGWAAWRAIEAEHGLGLVAAALSQAMTDGVLAPHPVDILAPMLLSAAIEAALVIAQAADHAAARAAAETALRALLTGLRAEPTGR